MKFNLSKSSGDTSLPVPSKDLVLVYAEDIAVMPLPNERGILTEEEIQLKVGAEFYEFYLTPASQKTDVAISGDANVKGFIPTISGTFPGTKLSVSEWLQNNINSEFVAIQRNCGGYYKIFGHKYNPLFIDGGINNDSESSLTEISFSTQKKAKRPYLMYHTTGVSEPSGCDCVLLIDLIT